MRLISITTSSKPEKKLQATFETDSGREKTTHFGQRSASDFTKNHDEARKANYLSRHSATENWNDPTSAGALSRWVLWNKPTLEASKADYKRRFGL